MFRILSDIAFDPPVTPPAEPQTAGSPLWWIVGVVAAAASITAIVIVLLVQKKKKDGA